jgi:hypothetical protein
VLDEAIWIDGRTICAKGSLGQCHPDRTRPEISETAPRS